MRVSFFLRIKNMKFKVKVDLEREGNYIIIFFDIFFWNENIWLFFEVSIKLL